MAVTSQSLQTKIDSDLKIIKRSPFLRGALCFAAMLCLLISSGTAFAANSWQERPHPHTDNITLRAAGTALYDHIGGYNNIVSNAFFFPYEVEAYFSPTVPLLSRLSWVSTPDVALSPKLASDEHTGSSYNQLSTELRLPFTTNFLSRQTSWYIQYSYTAKVADSLDSDFLYKNVLFNKESSSIGSRTHYAALTIDTPATQGDSPDSLSRFGIFYQFEERLRHATLETMTENELIGLNEHRIGFFYTITKPVFIEGFIMNLHLRAAFAFRKIHASPHDYSSADFRDSASLLMVDVGTSLAYRFKLGENAGIRLFADYEYNAVLALVAQSDFDNSYSQHIFGGLMLDYFF